MKARSIVLLVIAEILAMSLWFVSSAILGDLSQEHVFSAGYGAALTSSVPAGFVMGALWVSIAGIADRFDPRLVFSVSALLAALFNAGSLIVPVGGTLAVVLRFLTGACLAGVYPVGMKIAVGWGTKDRGLLVGLLVGGLTLGSAAPHLLSFLGGTNWRLTTLVASAMAITAALIVACVALGPHHGVAAKFRPKAVAIAWTDRRIRHAFAGYLGHMWELYAMWSWIGVALTVSFAVQLDPQDAADKAKLISFVAIGAGAMVCPFAGLLADKVGKARITIISMTVSCISAVLAGLTFGGPVWLMSIVVVVWGLSIIPDSAQFSALIADYAPPDLAGSLMTLQTALGFALTILTVQVTPLIAAAYGWPTVFFILALGPMVGILAMKPLLNFTDPDVL